MTDKTRTSLGTLLSRGGVYYALPGDSVQEVLENLIKAIPVPPDIPTEDLLQAVLEREALMSTGAGFGIAIPHPRNPITALPKEQFAALAFLDHPVDWKALDRSPVDTVLLVVSASAKFHLETLSAISYFCQQDGFLKLLRERASRETLIRFITDTEGEWN